MRRKLALALAGVGLVLAASWWFTPGLYDRLAYGGLARSCEGRVVLEGEVEGVSASGRHCRAGRDLLQTESGYFMNFEYARDGRVLLWGQGRPPSEPGPAHIPKVAMLRTPGDAGTWLCAGQVSWKVDEHGEHQLKLDQVGVLLREAELESVEGTLTVSEEQLRVEINHWLGTHPATGRSCSQDGERCRFDADEQRAVRAFARTEGSEGGYAFVLRENQRAARNVKLSVSSSPPVMEAMKTLELSELSEWVECPLASPGAGELTLRWKD